MENTNEELLKRLEFKPVPHVRAFSYQFVYFSKHELHFHILRYDSQGYIHVFKSLPYHFMPRRRALCRIMLLHCVLHATGYHVEYVEYTKYHNPTSRIQDWHVAIWAKWAPHMHPLEQVSWTFSHPGTRTFWTNKQANKQTCIWRPIL